MSKRKKANEGFDAPVCSPPPLRCPACGSTKIGGLMEAFWVPLKPDGDVDGEWNDWSGETEVGDKRLCYSCDHEFEV